MVAVVFQNQALSASTGACSVVQPDRSKYRIMTENVYSKCVFSVHARMEDLHEDSRYFLMKTGLLPMLSPNKVMNHKKEEMNPDYR